MSRKARRVAGKSKRGSHVSGKIGKALGSCGQMVFGTLFLGAVLRSEIPQHLLLLAGVVGALLFTAVGIFLSEIDDKNKE